MDLHEKIRLEHLAWFNKVVPENKADAPEEAKRPMDIEEQIVFDYKNRNHYKGDVDLSDVLYEKDITPRDSYFCYVNAFCELWSSQAFRLINGVKTIC